MTVQVVATQERSFALDSGWIAGAVSGSMTGRLVIGLAGLSGNLHSFDVVFEHLDPSVHRRLAYDMRGRGRSAKTPAGTYGWPAHARDVVALADELGHERFDLVGWSFGTWVAMEVCRIAPGRVRRVALIDGGGVPDAAALIPIHAGLERLGHVYASRDDFMTRVRATGFYEPWDRWQALFDYELEVVPGGVRARTWAGACREDDAFREEHFTYGMWDAVRVPSLLLRGRRPIPGSSGFILTQQDAERFRRVVPGSRAVDVDAHHYTVGMHDDTARYIAAFLDRE